MFEDALPLYVWRDVAAVQFLGAVSPELHEEWRMRSRMLVNGSKLTISGADGIGTVVGRLRMLLIGPCCCFIVCSSASAALTTVDGKSAEYWKSHSVLYAAVVGIEPQERREMGTHVVVLRPLATLSGRFDAGLNPEIRARVWVSPRTSSIESAPKIDSSVLVIVTRKEGEYIVPSAITTFMPDDAAMVSVEGFTDPRVADTLSRIQRLRATDHPMRK